MGEKVAWRRDQSYWMDDEEAGRRTGKWWQAGLRFANSIL